MGQPTSLCCGSLCWGGIGEGPMLLPWLIPAFSYFPQLPTSWMCPFRCWFPVAGFVYILGPCGPLQWTLLWNWEWEFLPLPQASQIFTVRGFEALPSCAGTLGCMVCDTPQLFLPAYLHTNVGYPGLPATTLSCVLTKLAPHLCLSYQFGWMLLL